MFNETLYEDDREEKLQKLPKCCCCKEPIQDEHYIDTPEGKYCDSCEFDYAKDLWFSYGRQDFVVRNEGL